jgi:hypothetical protein
MGTKFIFFTDLWRNHSSKVVNSPLTFAAVHSFSGCSLGFDSILVHWLITVVVVAQSLFQLNMRRSISSCFKYSFFVAGTDGGGAYIFYSAAAIRLPTSAHIREDITFRHVRSGGGITGSDQGDSMSHRQRVQIPRRNRFRGNVLLIYKIVGNGAPRSPLA